MVLALTWTAYKNIGISHMCYRMLRPAVLEHVGLRTLGFSPKGSPHRQPPVHAGNGLSARLQGPELLFPWGRDDPISRPQLHKVAGGSAKRFLHISRVPFAPSWTLEESSVRKSMPFEFAFINYLLEIIRRVSDDRNALKRKLSNLIHKPRHLKSGVTQLAQRVARERI